MNKITSSSWLGVLVSLLILIIVITLFNSPILKDNPSIKYVFALVFVVQIGYMTYQNILRLKRDDKGNLVLPRKVNIGAIFGFCIILYSLSNLVSKRPTLLFITIAGFAIIIGIEIALGKKSLLWIKDDFLFSMNKKKGFALCDLTKVTNPKNTILFTFRNEDNLKISLHSCTERDLKRFLNEIVTLCNQKVELDNYLTDFIEDY